MYRQQMIEKWQISFRLRQPRPLGEAADDESAPAHCIIKTAALMTPAVLHQPDQYNRSCIHPFLRHDAKPSRPKPASSIA